MCCVCRVFLIYALLVLGSAQATEDSGRDTYQKKPPLSADAFWKEILDFLNRDDGYATREQFAQTFALRFGRVNPEHSVLTHEIVVMTYQARAGVDWYFDASFQDFTAAWNMPGDPTNSGAHIDWTISWSEDSFGDPKKGQCITAAQVQRDLVRTGWAAPWPWWATMGAPVAQLIRAPAPAPFGVISEIPPRVANLGRERDRGTARWGELPFGRLFPGDAGPASCVTTISMAARAPAK
jgi:hypothetical protein